MRALKAILGLGMTLVFAGLISVGCSHKDVKPSAETAKAAGAPADEAAAANSVTSQPLSFNEGSDGHKIIGLESVHFSFNGSSIDQNGRNILKSNAAWMQSHPDLKIQVEGHCDDRGSVEYNLALGENRAKSVIKYLTDLGVPSSRLTTVSYGKERPLVTGQSEDAYAKNRRANFVPLK